MSDLEYEVFQEALRERDQRVGELEHLLAVAMRKVRRDHATIKELRG